MIQLKSPGSILGRFVRRINFLGHYLLAKAQSQKIRRLLPILQKSFDHPWVVGVDLKFRFWAGDEAKTGRTFHWDEPVTVYVFRKKKLALGMSLYIFNEFLYIGQLQGHSGTDIPPALRPWSKRFMEACRSFALQENLKGVSVAKAETLYSYRNPGLNPNLTETAREQILKQIRRDMRLIYDVNALDVGFLPDGNWLTWRNSESFAPAPPRA